MHRNVDVGPDGARNQEWLYWGKSAATFTCYILLRRVHKNIYFIFPSTQQFIKSTRDLPVTVPARSKAWIVFARSDAGIVGSNPTQGMDVWCVYAFILCCVVLCLGRGLATSWSLAQGVLPSVKMIMKLKKRPGPIGAVDPVKKNTCDLFTWRSYIWGTTCFDP
jgi:hypothetical protein